MSRTTSTSVLLAFFLTLSMSSIAQDGESIFKSTCAACHTTTARKLIGPGLANIHDKRTKEWFTKFVKSSQTFINSGDAEAVKIFEEYNKLLMPDQMLSDNEIDLVFEYIISVSPAKSDVAAVETVEEVEAPFEPTEEDIIIGQDLFSGVQRFENGGPSCISCHHVNKHGYIPGGELAVDLTDAYERLGKAGIEGMIVGLPFPQMKISYQNHVIAEEEAFQLTAFLKEVSEQRFYQSYSPSYNNILLIWGFAGAIVLMGVFPLFWYKRKKESVNKRIYDRQIKSGN